MADLRAFEDRKEMAQAAAGALAGRLAEAVSARGAAGLSVCGGTSPAGVYEALSEADIPWEHVVIALSDERWVDPGSDDSNEHLIQAHLLRGRAAGARFIGMKTAAPTPDEGVAELERRLGAFPRPAAAGVLGLGEDGHTASLFPDAELPISAMDPASPARVAPVTAPSGRGSAERMTMTLGELASHTYLAFVAHGPGKRAVIDAILDGEPAAQDWPAARVAACAGGAVDFYWAP